MSNTPLLTSNKYIIEINPLDVIVYRDAVTGCGFRQAHQNPAERESEGALMPASPIRVVTDAFHLSKPILAVSVLMAVAASVVPAAAAEQWHIKCFGMDGHTLAVKALTATGRTLDVKALGTDDQGLHDVKALLPDSGTPIPIKVVPSPDQAAPYSDVKAIQDGQLIAVKGITGSGESLDVKAFHDDARGRFDIKCIRGDGELLGLKAISPTGRVYDVKGIKELPDQDELDIELEAHIKAIPQKD